MALFLLSYDSFDLYRQIRIVVSFEHDINVLTSSINLTWLTQSECSSKSAIKFIPDDPYEDWSLA